MGDQAIVAKNQFTKDELFQRITYVYEKVNQSGDEAVAHKLYQLLEKLRDNEFVIGFCGHFSAGKSSMINELTGVHLLPSSPIPTSANVVKVKTGRAYARVYFKHQDPIEFPYPYNIKEIKAFCVDGDEVDAVEISHPSEELPKGISVMDTPGIDSTDDAHRVATESTLHLADVILYVMDYNHVQSELNFNFTKMVKEHGKKVYLVINQIDKHNEYELSFDSFQKGVVDSFRNWNVEPDGIFYTTLREKEHVHNDLDRLKAQIHTWMEKKDSFMLESVQHAALALLEEHEQWLKKNQEAERIQLESKIGSLTEEEKQARIEEWKQLNDAKNTLRTEEESFTDSFKEQMQKILNNAILMPFETRDYARLFLESQQKNFKVGLFFAKQKTEQEKQNRQAAFLHDLNEKAKAQLDWHLKDLIVKYGKKHDLYDEAFFKEVYDVNLEVPESLIHEKVRAQEEVSGDYVLNYTKETAELVKRLYRKKTEEQFEYLVELFQQNHAEQVEKMQEKLAPLEESRAVIEALLHLDEERNQVYAQYQEVLSKQDFPQDILKAALNRFRFKEESITIEHSEYKEEEATIDVQLIHKPQEKVQVEEATDIEVPLHAKEQLIETSHQLELAADTIQTIIGFETQAREMRERSKRLKNNRFTVALFGAFSAGKSSFANALMGEHILPVSPNPTTATINKILPVDEQNPHGTVRVKLKSVTQMEEDLRHSLKIFDLTANSIKEAIQTTQTMKIDVVEPKAKPHLSFLQAVVRGYEAVEQQLGEEVIVDLLAFQDYVAKEEKACFVEWIELYYDCPLTAQGIMLVDTPGADSINARHTGVAFEYIKNADAVLFVTYYNHAFSNADREFLIQLGRVKDTFALDKMFFLVNAKDLASSDEELEGVLTHVSDNLVSCGIRNPRMYPVSSQLALLSKVHHHNQLNEAQEHLYRKHTASKEMLMPAEQAFQQSGMNIFEKDFITFTITELTEMAINAAKADIERAKGTLDDFIQHATADQSVRLKKKEETEQLQKSVLHILKELDEETNIRSMEQEITELIYYVKQRLFLRYPDFFNAAFNPASLVEDGRDMKKALQKSLDEFMQMTSFDLAQELRATALRSENYMKKSLATVHEKLQKQVREETGEWTFLPYEPMSYATPQIEDTFALENEGKFQKVLSFFKNGKHFFEGEGKTKMRDHLQDQLDEPVSLYLEKENQKLKQYYSDLFKEAIALMEQNLIQEANEYFAGKLAVLSMNVNVSQLKEARQQLGQIM